MEKEEEEGEAADHRRHHPSISSPIFSPSLPLLSRTRRRRKKEASLSEILARSCRRRRRRRRCKNPPCPMRQWDGGWSVRPSVVAAYFSCWGENRAERGFFHIFLLFGSTFSSCSHLLVGHCGNGHDQSLKCKLERLKHASKNNLTEKVWSVFAKHCGQFGHN